jgi:hypothetical protein
VTLFERNRFKYGPQLSALGAIDHLHKTDAAFEVRAKVRDPLAVLRIGTETNAVGQHRLQYLKITPAKIHLLVHDDAGETLPHASAHDSRLVMVHAEAFLKCDCRCMRREALDTPAEFLAARKRKIVRVARVRGPGGPRQTGEAAIQMERRDVGERGRFWGALRQMQARVKDPCFPPILCADFERTIVPDGTWNCIRADTAQAVGYLLGISERSKHGLHTRGWKCGKEILQIESQHEMLAHMRRRKSDDRSSFDESVDGRMGRDPIEDRCSIQRCSSFSSRFGLSIRRTPPERLGCTW